MSEERIAALMKSLDLSREEAIELLNEDKEVDRMDMGQVDNDLTADQKQTIKKMRKADRTPTAYKWKKPERKPNEEKRELIHLLETAVATSVDELTVTNPERQIDFVYNNTRYSIVLSAPRK